MSTHPQHTTESNPTPDAPTETAAPTTPPADDAGQQRDAESWVARCQAQFDAGGSARLRNLADDANHAMPDGV